jgi:hypothetical protein
MQLDTIVEQTEICFIVPNMANGNETLSVLATLHSKAAAERPLYCHSQEKLRKICAKTVGQTGQFRTPLRGLKKDSLIGSWQNGRSSSRRMPTMMPRACKNGKKNYGVGDGSDNDNKGSNKDAGYQAPPPSRALPEPFCATLAARPSRFIASRPLAVRK